MSSSRLFGSSTVTPFLVLCGVITLSFAHHHHCIARFHHCNPSPASITYNSITTSSPPSPPYVAPPPPSPPCSITTP